jgi:hypothetical protein
MDLATQSRIDAIRQLSPERKAQLTDDELAQIEAFVIAAKYEEIDALCRREETSFDCGPLLYLTKFTKTENPQCENRDCRFWPGSPKKIFHSTFPNIPGPARHACDFQIAYHDDHLGSGRIRVLVSAMEERANGRCCHQGRK